MANEIYINDEEFTDIQNAIDNVLYPNLFEESEQRTNMNNVYSDVQETAITENYTLDISMLLSMTGMCFEIMRKSVEALMKIGEEMHSVDALMERCIDVIKGKEGK